MAERLGAEEGVVVTSRYHMPRSAWTFRVVAAALGSRVKLGEAAAAEEKEEGKEGSCNLEREARLLRRSQAWVREGLGREVEGMESVEGPLEEIRQMLMCCR